MVAGSAGVLKPINSSESGIIYEGSCNQTSLV